MAAAVDVFNLPNYRLTGSQSEWFWLFSIMVAGKKAEVTVDKLNAFLLDAPFGTPLESIRVLMVSGKLGERLRHHKVGQYRRIEAAFRYSAKMRKNLWNCGIIDLEKVPGVGPKTSRFFIMMTRRNMRVAALDTHILKFLRDCGHDAPTSTPPAGKKYDRLEKAFLQEADRRGERDIGAFDLKIWTEYRNK